MKRTTKQLEAAVGGLSNPSKMPGLSYGTPAAACGIGAILRARKGTVCSSCYAHKGMYGFPVVRRAQERRLEILSSNLPEWQADMTELLSRKFAKKSGPDAVFRWHDSGDIQSVAHLEAIVEIAESLEWVQFWLPTKEYGIIRQWLGTRPEGFPMNLTVRISAPTIGRPSAPIRGTVGSTVDLGSGHSCPAPSQGGTCGDCRACWDQSVSSVDYHKH